MSPRMPHELARLSGRLISAFWINPGARTALTRGKCLGAFVRSLRGRPAGPVLSVSLAGPGGRTLLPHYVPVVDSALVFEGLTDRQSDADAVTGHRVTRGFYGAHANGLLNIVGAVPDLRRWIETENRNPLFTAFDLVIAVRFEADQAGRLCRRIELPVFPEVPTEHAIVRRIREDAQRFF